MSVNIVTGFTGRAHITSDDDRIRNAAYIGTDKFVMPFGNQFEAEVQNNNLVRIKDGMLMNQGTQMGIELTDYEDVVIENGLSGTNRNDLIVMRYEKQDDTGLESASLVVIKGTSGATASDPTYISGNIIDGGDLIDDYPLYRVKIESLSIVAVQQLFSTRADVGSELNRIETAFNNKMEKNNPTGTGSFSMNRKENTTVGSKSVAVNRNTTASGDSSFASGFNTTASGDYSNAAGNSTTASGGYSHSEGVNTTASGTASHAEGSSTKASAYNSHAEGESTTASGRASHAEGMNTTASGERSHAAGYWTTAGYSNQTVVGKHNDNKETNLFEVGNGTSSSNRSNALEVRQNGDIYAGGDFYDGDGNKLGGDKMDKTNPTGTGSFSMNRKANTTVGGLSATVNENNTASGDGSFASGRNNTASGLCSNASGTSTTASGSCSRAEGMNTTASGSCSHSEGESTTASGRVSHAEGMNTTASGERSHAAGYWTTAGYPNQTVVGKHNDNSSANLFEVGNGTDSSHRSNALEVRQNGDVHAGGDFYDGDGNKLGGDKMDKTNPTGTGSFSMNRKAGSTVGDKSVAVGEGTTASGALSHAEGASTTASGVSSHSEGNGTKASGLYSHAEGETAAASGRASHAEGISTKASGALSHAEGASTTASGVSSHSEGNGTEASELYSHAEGEGTTASGRASHAEGISTKASADASHAEGNGTKASGLYCHAGGTKTNAGYENQTAIGKFNNNKSENLFEIGNGTGENARSNAFEVSESGNAIAGADLLYDGHKRITGSYASDILVECTDLKLGPDNTITGRDKDNVPIHTGTYDLKVGSIIYVPEDLHFGMNVPAGIYEVLYLVDGGNGISYLSFGDYQRDEPDPEHVKYMPKSLEERIETALLTTKIATGNPISISDSAHVNAEELTVKLEPIQSGSGDPSPTNIRPISGYDETSVVIKDTAENPTVTGTYTLQFGDTVYGAAVDFVSGVATVTHGYIAEYAGETLPSTWISDRDEYASGTTPTTGAQVVYELASPQTIQLTPQQIKMLKGNNVLTADGDMELVYQVDSVVGDVKEWAEEHFIPYNTYRTPPVYGFHIDWSNSDPSSRVTYIADNANFMSAYMDYTSDKFRYNSWRDIWFIKYCKPCILNQDGTVKAYLNPNDSTKDIDGNTVTIDENLTGANVEIEFPEIWYKVVPDAGNVTSASVYFSPVKVDEDYKDYAYIDKNGVHKEHFYMPAYNGSVLSGTTVMRSISGQAVSKNLDASTEIAYAKANGDGWNTEDAGEIMLINLLLILLGKSTDTQTVFGRGIDSGGETAFNNYVTGTGNLKGLFYGTNTGTGLVKVFGIENWWGLQWRRYAGDVLDNGVRKVKLCYGNEDGSTTFDFNIDGTGYVDVGVTPSGTNGGYIRTMKFTHDGMYSAISDGSSSTYYCDGQWFSNTYHTIYALRGGNSADGVRCGAFCVPLSISPGYRAWAAGAAVSYK